MSYCCLYVDLVFDVFIGFVTVVVLPQRSMGDRFKGVLGGVLKMFTKDPAKALEEKRKRAKLRKKAAAAAAGGGSMSAGDTSDDGGLDRTRLTSAGMRFVTCVLNPFHVFCFYFQS